MNAIPGDEQGTKRVPHPNTCRPVTNDEAQKLRVSDAIRRGQAVMISKATLLSIRGTNVESHRRSGA